MDEDLVIDYEDVTDETDAEREAREGTEVELDENSQDFVDRLVDKLMQVTDMVSGHPLRRYQRPFARRIYESLIINDGATITALFARQCLDGDTIIFDRDGSAMRISEHPGATMTGHDPVKRYRLRGGSEIVMTDNHPVVDKERGYIEAGDLKVGDYISIAQGVSQWAGQDVIDATIDVGRYRAPREVRQEVTKSLARFLGYMTSDGSMRTGQSVKFTNTREEYLSEVESFVRELWNIEPKRYAKGNGYDLLFTTSKSSFDNPLLDTMHAIERDHGFPLDVFRWSPELVSEFVNRAWSGDGCIHMKKRGPEISLACGNDEIYARFWRSLLLKFEVMSTVKAERMKGGTGTFYRLVVGSGARNMRRFFQSFGLIYGKEEKCLEAIDYFAEKAMRPSGKGRAERVPFKEHGYGPDGEYLVWAKVESIEDLGSRDVWDISVPSKGWFIAEGVQVGNTGKSETVANVIATAMIMLPRLAKAFPGWLGKYAEGVWVGAFAPVDEQADNLFGRIVARLTSDSAVAVMQDPDVNAVLVAKGRSVYIRFIDSDAPLTDGKGHCLVRKTTAHPRATIEGRSYHIILVDECQGADDKVINKSVGPMGAAYNATMVFTGTPTYTKNVFYNQIQINKREATKRGRMRVNHFEVDWREASKENDNYRKFVLKEMIRLGEDSDEFKLSYRLMWLLDKGMFTTSEKLDGCGDTSMQSLIPAWNKTPVVVGIDCARKQDRTIVTVLYVDWDHPDELGMYHHRVLNWLDLEGEDWETQYYKIVEFLSNYQVWKIGIDAGGVGDVVAERLRILMPQTEIVDFGSSQGEQSDRWKYLRSLIDRRQIVWPAGAKVRRLKIWRRFRQELEDLEILFKGPYVLAAAPEIRDAHDDYADSLAIGCYLTKEYEQEEVGQVEVAQNPFYGGHTRSRYR